MSNHSSDYPNGILDKGTLKSFFAITEHADGSLTWQPGYERIPIGWYRRPLGITNEYSPASFALDLYEIAQAVPEAVSVGGNTGTTNSFVGVDLGDITGGAYHTEDLLVPSKFACFFYQLSLAVVPDFLRSMLLGTLSGNALDLLQSEIRSFIDPACATIGENFSSLFCFIDVKADWPQKETIMMISRLNSLVQLLMHRHLSRKPQPWLRRTDYCWHGD